jgi:hypothetical protein
MEVYRDRVRHLSGIDRRDVALAAVVLLAGQVDVLAPNLFSTSLVGPRWAVSLVYLVCAGAVVLRRVMPGTAFAIMTGSLAVQAVTVGTTEGNGALFPALILSYSVAMYGTRRVAIAALCTIPCWPPSARCATRTTRPPRRSSTGSPGIWR